MFIEIFKFGTSGKYKFGNCGNNIGLETILNSGNQIVIHALILCKSIIISGHFGNCITGISGIIALINCQTKVIRSHLSFLHSLHSAS
jgi:hypothetical protein